MDTQIDNCLDDFLAVMDTQIDNSLDDFLAVINWTARVINWTARVDVDGHGQMTFCQ